MGSGSEICEHADMAARAGLSGTRDWVVVRSTRAGVNDEGEG